MAHNQIVKAFGDSPMKGQPYVFQEFPKHVTVKGQTFTVNNREEETALLKDNTVISADDEKARLTKIAESHGLVVDGRWKLDKLRAVIENAGYDTEPNKLMP